MLLVKISSGLFPFVLILQFELTLVSQCHGHTGFCTRLLVARTELASLRREQGRHQRRGDASSVHGCSWTQAERQHVHHVDCRRGVADHMLVKRTRGFRDSGRDVSEGTKNKCTEEGERERERWWEKRQRETGDEDEAVKRKEAVEDGYNGRGQWRMVVGEGKGSSRTETW